MRSSRFFPHDYTQYPSYLKKKVPPSKHVISEFMVSDGTARLNGKFFRPITGHLTTHVFSVYNICVFFLNLYFPVLCFWYQLAVRGVHFRCPSSTISSLWSFLFSHQLFGTFFQFSYIPTKWNFSERASNVLVKLPN